MDTSNKLRVVLFALTGFGNKVLDGLLQDSRVEVGAVFTVKYDNPFPYYPEKQLFDVCSERRVNCYHGIKVSSEAGMSLLRDLSPDLILVSTFKQILGKNVLGLPSLGAVNFHPSLLPRYRGPCPTNNVLLNDESVTGVTVHYMTEELDEGNILLQRSMEIREEDNDGRIRQRLAVLAGEMVPKVIGLFIGHDKPIGSPQDKNLVTFAPRLSNEEGYLELTTDIHAIRCKVRSLNPFPGTSFLVKGKRIAVDRYKLVQDDGPDSVCDQEDHIDVVINCQGIRLFKKPLNNG